jgi:hypothetical protein
MQRRDHPRYVRHPDAGHATRPPPQGGGTQTLIGVVVRTYHGDGTFSQVDNIKGSVTGVVPDRPGSGTYQVNPDCSGVNFFSQGRASPLRSEW